MNAELDEYMKTACEGCAYPSNDLKPMSWTHNQRATSEGWCGEDGQIHRGFYCPECIRSIKKTRLES